MQKLKNKSLILLTFVFRKSPLHTTYGASPVLPVVGAYAGASTHSRRSDSPASPATMRMVLQTRTEWPGENDPWPGKAAAHAAPPYQQGADRPGERNVASGLRDRAAWTTAAGGTPPRPIAPEGSGPVGELAVGWAALKILLDAPRIFLCGGTAVGCDGRGPGGRDARSGRDAAPAPAPGRGGHGAGGKGAAVAQGRAGDSLICPGIGGRRLAGAKRMGGQFFGLGVRFVEFLALARPGGDQAARGRAGGAGLASPPSAAERKRPAREILTGRRAG